MSALRDGLSLSRRQRRDETERDQLLSLSEENDGQKISVHDRRDHPAPHPMYRDQRYSAVENDYVESDPAVRDNDRIFIDHLFYPSVFCEI